MPNNDAKIGHLRLRYSSPTVQHLMRSPDKHLKLWNPFTVEITQAANQADPGLTSPVNFKLTFSDAPSPSPSAAQWNTYIALSGTANATTKSVSGSGTTRNVAVSGMTQPGTVIINIAADQFTRDGGQYNEAATLTDNQIAYHGLFVTIAMAQGQTSPGYGTEINWTVTFSESVSDFTAADVTILGNAPGTKTATVTGAGTTYNVKITGMTGNGSVWFRLGAGVVSNQYGGTNPQTDSPQVTFDAPRWRSLGRSTSNVGGEYAYGLPTDRSTITLDPATAAYPSARSGALSSMTSGGSGSTHWWCSIGESPGCPTGPSAYCHVGGTVATVPLSPFPVPATGLRVSVSTSGPVMLGSSTSYPSGSAVLGGSIPVSGTATITLSGGELAQINAAAAASSPMYFFVGADLPQSVSCATTSRSQTMTCDEGETGGYTYCGWWLACGETMYWLEGLAYGPAISGSISGVEVYY